MVKRDILLEIGLEEIPARFVTSSMKQLEDKVTNWLVEKKIGFGEIKAYSTPRRLAVLVRDVLESQEDIHEEAKGPAKKIALSEAGEWSKAAIGFSRGQGMSVEDIFFKEIGGVEYAHVKKFIKGQETKSILVDLKDIILSLNFAKNMRWANNDLRYVRPIKWIVALFGSEVISFTITHIETGRKTMGHRFLGESVEITSPELYETTLMQQNVVVDPIVRKESIVNDIKQIEKEKDWIIPIDEDLLEEVNNLVELPTALFGRFEEEFLEIPEEVLITSMKEHQRYFPVKSKEGKLLPYFITVRNGGKAHLETVAKGNEKVLRARLADAAFFYNEDQKLEIDFALRKLKAIVYHEEIGTIAEKVERVRKLTNILASKLTFSEVETKNADRAAQIAKFDLVTQMVYEFPELQGFMGEKYALQKGENESVAKAINEHYMPRNAEDSTPTSDAGAVLSISEKMDTIVSCFSIGIIPTGSQDPYALRRQATGIVQTLINKNWPISMEDIIQIALNEVVEAGIAKRTNKEIFDDLLSFFKARVKHLLQEQSIRYDLIDAVLEGDIHEVSSLVRRAQVLDTRKEDPEFKESVEALSRVINISSKATLIKEIKEELFENEQEKVLYAKYKQVQEYITEECTEEQYFDLLISLKAAISQYFDHTMVMSEDENIKANRLNQMVKIASLILRFANMNTILVK